MWVSRQLAAPLLEKGFAMKRLMSALAVASLLASPVSASVREAAFASSSDRPTVHTSMFVGATFRVGLDGRTSEAKGRASLKISPMTWDPRSSQLRFSEGLAISGGRTGRPALFLAGQDVGQFERRNNLSTGAAIAIGVGVVLLAGVAVFALSHPFECYDEDQHARCD